jgi:glycosyltransferase involved in cell wall biosynthesis
VDLLLEGLSRIERGRVTVVIAGTFEHSGAFDPVAYARAKGCSGDVVFIPKYVSREEMDVIFGAADAVILPYRSYFQGQSDVLLTACEYGLAVLASEVGDLGAKVRTHELGLLFPPDRADAVAAALSRFAEMPATALASFQPRLRRYAGSRPWSTVAQELRQLYAQTLACARRSETLPANAAPRPNA